VIKLNGFDHEGLRYSHLEELTSRSAVKGWIQTERRMGAESIPRWHKAETTCRNPVVQNSEWAVRVERKDDDFRLHEPLRRFKRESYRRGLGSDWLQLLA
jgi:hypothetical protein